MRKATKPRKRYRQNRKQDPQKTSLANAGKKPICLQKTIRKSRADKLGAQIGALFCETLNFKIFYLVKI